MQGTVMQDFLFCNLLTTSLCFRHCIIIGYWLVHILQKLLEGYDCTESEALCINRLTIFW